MISEGNRFRAERGYVRSPLDDIRTTFRYFDGELQDFLWGLEATVDRLPALDALLDELLTAEHLPATAFPMPTSAEQQGARGGSTLFPTRPE